MTAAMPAVGGPRGLVAQPPQPSGPTPAAGVPSFGQALAQVLGERSPTAGSAAAGRPSVTLGQMLGRSRLAFVPQVGAPAAPGSPAAPAGTMVVPASGRVSSEFGPRVHPITGQRRPHTGTDIAAATGTPVRAAAGGTVTFAGSRGGYGNLVILDHGDGRETYYAHNSAHQVAVGDRVAAGQHIAGVGQTGMATGPHLHFDVRVNGVPVEPRDHVSLP